MLRHGHAVTTHAAGGQRKSLPEHTEDVFGLLAECLESSGDKPRDMPCPEFDHLRYETMRRVHWGEEQYGDRWRGRSGAQDAREELNDVFAYLAGRIGESAHSRPHLWSALVNAFRAYRDVLADEAQQKGSP